MNNRIYYFLATLFVCILLEFITGKRENSFSFRVVTNVFLILTATLLLKLVFPYGLITLLEKTNTNPSSFSFTNLPLIFEIPLVIIVFDFIIYWQHRLFHKLPYLWQIHKIHHCDKAMDTTTALRFHPLEILISGAIKLFFISILNPSAQAFLTYEILLSSFAIFNHANIYITKPIDKVLRLFIVTPSFHTPHHSPHKTLTNSNYGNFLSIWDFLFKSYEENENDDFGLDDVKTDNYFTLFLIPFNYPIFKRKED